MTHATRAALLAAALSSALATASAQLGSLTLPAGTGNDPRSVILDQVTNGVAIRMAVLYLLLGEGGKETETGPGPKRKRGRA